MPTAGSWLGLPDFGVTEYLAGKASGGQTRDLSNALTGNYSPQASAPIYNGPISSPGVNKSPGVVLGAQDTNRPTPQQPVNNNPANSWSDSKNEGYFNGQLYRDVNEWRKASGMDPYGGSNPSDEARRREEETRNGIRSGYGQYRTGLEGLKTSYEGERESSLGSAAEIYDKIFGGLTEQKTTNEQKLEAGRGAVNLRTSESVKDLKDNLNTTVRGMSMQMGAMGAGDTSAAKVMMPYAYTKLAGQQEGGIRKQSNEQLFQIDQEERDTNLTFSQMWKETEIEKVKELDGIKERYGSAIRNVQSALASAPLEEQQALTSLNQSLLQEALANLRTSEARIEQDRKDIKTWATNRLSSLNDAKIQLGGTANFQPKDIVFDELKMMGSTAPTMANAGSYDWNPNALAKKVREENGYA